MSIAVFDLGKTNSKLLVVSEEGRVLHEARSRPSWVEADGFRVLDDAALLAWMDAALGAVADELAVSGVIVSGHGCTFALVGDAGLVHPVLDYEQEPPPAVAARIDARIPPFAETFSPRLPLGFNFGRHMLWLADAVPGVFERTSAILGYPQFWSWRLSGVPVSEVSYLGCHSHLWAPLAGDFSSLVDSEGWRAKMPPFARAGAPLGPCDLPLASGGTRRIAVHNGVHDSNAALALHRAAGHDDFTLVSTGTWVIILNTAASLDVLDETRDMLANVDVDRAPVATIRFMGGREFDVVSENWTQAIPLAAIEAVLAKSIMALPSFAPGGPVQGRKGALVGPSPSPEERAAAALLYVALMTDLALDAIRSTNTIVVDGGLIKQAHYLSILRQLRPAQPVLKSGNAEGSALGAAALAFESIGIAMPVDAPKPVAPAGLAGLEAYRDRWRAHLAEPRLERAS